MYRAPWPGRLATVALVGSLLCCAGAAAAAPAVAVVSRHFIYLQDYDVLPDLRHAGFGPPGAAFPEGAAPTGAGAAPEGEPGDGGGAAGGGRLLH